MAFGVTSLLVIMEVILESVSRARLTCEGAKLLQTGLGLVE